MTESEKDLKSKLMMLAIESISKRIDTDSDLLIRWLEGRCALPSSIVKKIEQLTYNTAPIFYEVIDDPVESTAGKMLVSKLDEIKDCLENFQAWTTAVGIKTTQHGVCAINRYGEPVTPWFSAIKELWAFLEAPVNITTVTFPLTQSNAPLRIATIDTE